MVLGERHGLWRQLALDSNVGSATQLSHEVFQPSISCLENRMTTAPQDSGED